MSEQPKKRKDVYSPGFYVGENPVVFEEIHRNEGPVYAREDEPGSLQPTIQIGEKTYRVRPKVPWNLPPEPISYKDDLSLFQEVKQYLYDYYELRETGAYDVWAGAALASHRIEDWDTCPYLCFLGPRRSGKTTALRISKQVFHRCVGGPSVSAAWIASVIDRYDCTVVFDEAQLWKAEDKSDHLAILRGGYQRDMPRYKMISTGRGFTDVEQRIFGFKLIGCEMPVEPGIMERCVLFHTAKRTRKLLPLRKPEFQLRGDVLRGKLLMYRFRHVGQEIPEEIDTELEEIREDRLQELGYPILASTPVEVHDSIIAFFHEQEKRMKSEEETGEWADYVRAIADCVANSKIEAGGIILLKNFRDSLMKATETLDAKFLDSPKKNRRILDSLAFKRARTNEGVGFLYDDKLQKELEARFTPTPVEPTQPTQPTLYEGNFENEVKDVKVVKVSGGYGMMEIDGHDLEIVRKSIRQLEERQGYALFDMLKARVREESNGIIDEERLTRLMSQMFKNGELKRHANLTDCWNLA